MERRTRLEVPAHLAEGAAPRVGHEAALADGSVATGAADEGGGGREALAMEWRREEIS